MIKEEWYVILNMNCKYEICRKCPKSGLFKGSYEECEKWIKQKHKEEKKDEMKNKISMALKDPILQQGFEIICKENAELKKSVNNWLKYEKETQYHKSIIKDLKKENAQLKEKLNFSTQYYQGEKAKDQLTKAKELIDRFVNHRGFWNTSVMEEAEQFLNSEVEK